jgi:hypothetical protein
VTNLALLFEHPKLGANRRVRGIAAQLGHHFPDRGPATPVQDIHDLPLGD